MALLARRRGVIEKKSSFAITWQVEKAFEKLGAEPITGIIRRWLLVWSAARTMVV